MISTEEAPNNTLLSIGVGSDAKRAIAEIQSALTVASQRPRNEMRCIERIKVSCQRPRLAENAEYSYSRGGTEIIGATIDLLTVIANHWGNIQFGFRELSQRHGESEVEAFAWDLETNARRSVTFTVPHKRSTKRGVELLTDPRDVYELVANMAQRRVRACLEAVIPSDIVDEAVDQARETLKTSCKTDAEAIKGLLDGFAKFGVVREMIEARIQRRIDSITPAQFISMRRIWKSISDGMSTAKDWFEQEQQITEDAAPTTQSDRIKAAAKKTATQPADPTADTVTLEAAVSPPGSAQKAAPKQQKQIVSKEPTIAEIQACKTMDELHAIGLDIDKVADNAKRDLLRDAVADRQNAIDAQRQLP